MSIPMLDKVGQMQQTAIMLGERVLLAIAVLIAFWITAVITKKFILKIAKKTTLEKQYVFNIVGNFCKITIIIIGIITALGTAGINVSAIVASLGLSGFALGFALKDFLSNTLAGFMILLYQPYKIGQEITVDKENGKVVEINLRYTVLFNEAKRILIPNATMLNSSVTVAD